jgi:hypothetical protein
MWRKFRIAVLLLILLFVALNTYLDRVYSSDWKNPLRVAAFPINGDGSSVSERYVQALTAENLQTVAAFLAEEAAYYDLGLSQPVRFSVAAPLTELPPMIAPGASGLGVLWWSLRARYWAWRVDSPPGTDVQLFVLYHDPQRSRSLPHSFGLQKGLFGVVHAFADSSMEGSNDVVLAHELLHTLGATDKYDPSNNQPLHPQGYADPEQVPLYPQSTAELMGGRIPITDSRAETPASLNEVVIGPFTAAEIGWTRR